MNLTQSNRRSLLVGACRKRQDQIRQKLAQVRQRLQLGTDVSRWHKVEQDLLERYEQEEQRVQRLLNESVELPPLPAASADDLPAVESKVTRDSREQSAKTTKLDSSSASLQYLQRQLKRAQLLLAQKNAQIQELKSQLEAQPGQDTALETELQSKAQIIDELRLEQQAQVNKLLQKDEQLQLIQAQVDQLKKAAQVHRQVAERAQARHNEVVAKNEALSGDLALNAEVLGRLQFDLELKVSENTQLMRCNEELQIRLKSAAISVDLQVLLDQARVEIQRLTQENADLAGYRERTDGLQLQLDDLLSELHQNRLDTQDYQNTILQLQQQLELQQRQMVVEPMALTLPAEQGQFQDNIDANASSAGQIEASEFELDEDLEFDFNAAANDDLPDWLLESSALEDKPPIEQDLPQKQIPEEQVMARKPAN